MLLLNCSRSPRVRRRTGKLIGRELGVLPSSGYSQAGRTAGGLRPVPSPGKIPAARRAAQHGDVTEQRRGRCITALCRGGGILRSLQVRSTLRAIFYMYYVCGLRSLVRRPTTLELRPFGARWRSGLEHLLLGERRHRSASLGAENRKPAFHAPLEHRGRCVSALAPTSLDNSRRVDISSKRGAAPARDDIHRCRSNDPAGAIRAPMPPSVPLGPDIRARRRTTSSKEKTVPSGAPDVMRPESRLCSLGILYN